MQGAAAEEVMKVIDASGDEMRVGGINKLANQQQLIDFIASLDNQTLKNVIRSFSIYFFLANLSEENYLREQRHALRMQSDQSWEGSFRRSDRLVDLGGAGLLDFAEHLASCGIDIVETLRTFGFDEGTVDEGTLDSKAHDDRSLFLCDLATILLRHERLAALRLSGAYPLRASMIACGRQGALRSKSDRDSSQGPITRPLGHRHPGSAHLRGCGSGLRQDRTVVVVDRRPKRDLAHLDCR